MCVDCGVYRLDAVMVAIIEAGSGPGGTVYACPDHARMRAERIDAPTWLRKDVAALDATQ